jgi:site-specific DNA recombinase
MSTAIYCRKSTKQKQGADKDSAPSVVVQSRSCTEYAERNGLTDLVVYTDDALSGKAGVHRPQFEKLKADVESGKVTSVLVWRSDRLSRDQLDTLVFERLIRSHNVKTYSVSEGGLVDLETAAGRMQAGVRGLFNAYEREATAERVANQKRDAAQSGRVLGSRFRQFGYADTHRTALHATESLEVKQIFEKFLSGKSLASIVNDINARNVATTGGNKFDAETVKRILRHGSYAGQREFKGEVVAQGTWPTIVSVADWQRAKAKLDASRTGAKQSKRKYLLSGVLYCDNCKATLTANNNRYVCTKAHRGCGRIARTRTDIDKFVLKVTAQALARLMFEQTDEPVDNTELESVLADIDALSDARAAGIIPMAEYLKQYQQLAKRKDELVAVTTSSSVSKDDAANFLSAEIPQQRDVIVRLFGAIGLKPVTRGTRFKPEHLIFE